MPIPAIKLFQMNLQTLPESVIEIGCHIGLKSLQVSLALDLELLNFVLKIAFLSLQKLDSVSNISTEPARLDVFPLEVGELEVLLPPKVLMLVLRAATEQLILALSLLHSLLGPLLKQLTRDCLRVVFDLFKVESFATGAD